MFRFIGVALFFSSLLLAQSSGTQAQQACRIKELLNPQGWDIPALAGATVKTRAHYNSEGIPENVFLEIMEPQTPAGSFTVVGLRSCDMAVLNVRSVDVTKIERFSINGRVFGYRVTGTLAGNDKDGRRLHFGSEERAYYYDADGSGKFSVMRYDTGELIFKIIIPEWVKQATGSQARPPKL